MVWSAPEVLSPVPELPDVEVYRQYLDATSLHKNIQRVEVADHRLLDGVSASRLKDKLVGSCFRSTRTHGKHLFVEVDGGWWLVYHFGMSGFPKYFKRMDKEPPHDRFLVGFENGYHLAYDSQRRLGKIRLVKEVERFVEESNLGPHALDPGFGQEEFREVMEGRRGMIKPVLMSQQILAGIGNIYADEILFQADIHPRTRADKLASPEMETLFQCIKGVLRTAIGCRADPERFPDSFLTPHREEAACARSAEPVCDVPAYPAARPTTATSDSTNDPDRVREMPVFAPGGCAWCPSSKLAFAGLPCPSIDSCRSACRRIILTKLRRHNITSHKQWMDR
jgi:formamidopyrimidine-DNA glycosylase